VAGDEEVTANLSLSSTAAGDEELRRAATPVVLGFNWGRSLRKTRAWELTDTLAAREETGGHARARRCPG
jgi:hypothetical protein